MTTQQQEEIQQVFINRQLDTTNKQGVWDMIIKLMAYNNYSASSMEVMMLRDIIIYNNK
jgi:hypothetical protein